MQIKKKNFTLFELLISVGLLVILSVVLLRTFALTSDYWQYSKDQSEMYIDNKVVLSMLGDELSNIVYNYSNISGDYETEKAQRLFAPINIKEFDLSNNLANIAGTDSNKAKALCFVAHTRLDSEAKNSDICKIAYVYYPPRTNGFAGYNNLDEDKVPDRQHGGVLVRAILDEDDSFDLTGGQTLDAYFNFATDNMRQVVSGIIDFQIYAYKYVSTETDVSKKLQQLTSATGDKGYTEVRAIQLVYTYLPPKAFEDYRLNYQDKKSCSKHSSEDYCEQQAFLQKNARTFSRTFWINPMTDAN